jgi:hypothetical protein
MNSDHPVVLAPAVAAPLRTVLRLEAAAVLAVGLLGYQQLDGHWGRFGLLFLAPDLALLGYLAGPRIGALAYNALHSYIGPMLLMAVATLVPALHSAPGQGLVILWWCHIAFDRMVGYGLKYPTDFGDTHLGHVGRNVGRA